MKNSVIVIGAGANKEINQSIGLGSDLLKGIIERIVETGRHAYLSAAFDKHLPHLNKYKRQDFKDTLVQYQSHQKNNPSIDAFIYELQNYPEYERVRATHIEIARVMIMAHVLGWEGADDKIDPSGQRNVTYTNICNEKHQQKTWFSVLANYIKSNNLFDTDHLKIVTFNYDRILERFLLEFFNGSNEIKDFLNKNILHIYGRVGCLPELEPLTIGNGKLESKLSFGHHNSDYKTFSDLKDNINLLHDKIKEENIKKIMRSADKVLVFGYGFNYLNNKRMMFENRHLSEKIAFDIYHGSNDNKFIERRLSTEAVLNMARKSTLQFMPPVNFLRWGLNEFDPVKYS